MEISTRWLGRECPHKLIESTIARTLTPPNILRQKVQSNPNEPPISFLCWKWFILFWSVLCDTSARPCDIYKWLHAYIELGMESQNWCWSDHWNIHTTGSFTEVLSGWYNRVWQTRTPGLDRHYWQGRCKRYVDTSFIFPEMILVRLFRFLFYSSWSFVN